MTQNRDSAQHLSDDETFLIDDEGWFTARCLCGWSQGPLPGPGEVADALMEHVAETRNGSSTTDERAEAAEAAALERLREAMARETRRLVPLTPAEASVYWEGFHDGQDAASEDRIERLLALIADVLVGSTPAGKKADEYAARLAATGEPTEPREPRPRSRQEQQAHDFLEDLKANPEMVRDLARGHEAAVEPPKDEPRRGVCGLCGQPMPPGEEMFRYHGYSGPCPTGQQVDP